ncbi:Radical SAM domain protein [Desulfovibrio sp. X2]|uniref:radical SAM protein n=1 Tax=Desulfovibrio sp. X2 TaxID=941449 RepID=UPI000358861A|nr:radical SAM protein [Desulfovibrio sp. X2]EPR41662.1 Radical SAM domain protein [Desulfovibrio sp. X2]
MRPICAFPWHYLLLGHNVFGPCCSLLFQPEGLDISQDGIMELYHGAKMRELRARLAGRDIAGTPCEACVRGGGHMPDFPAFEGRGATPAAHEASRRAFEAGEADFAAPPRVYNLMTSLRCNLRCVMCYPSKPDHDRDGIDASALLDALDRLGWENVAEMIIAGGEPFLTRDALAVIAAAAEAPRGPALRVYTNGLLLHAQRELLERLEKIHLMLSLEATGEDYGKIRVGGSWNRLLANLRMVSEMAREKPGWQVTTVSVIMRSSLPHLAGIVNLARELGFTPSFGTCRDNYLDENIFAFPHLLEGSGWKEHLDAAVAACGDDFPAAAAHLAEAGETLARNLAQKTYTMSSAAMGESDEALADWLGAAFDGEPYVVFGTDTSLLGALTMRPEQKHLQAVYDFTEFPGSYCGHALRRAEDIAGYTGNVLVCAPTNLQAKYADVLARSAPQASVRFRPFWWGRTQRRIDALVDELGERPVVGFGTGGAAARILADSRLGELHFAAFADNDKSSWGKEFLGRPVINPADIGRHAGDVVILSKAYQESIRRQLVKEQGPELKIHCIFSDD